MKQSKEEGIDMMGPSNKNYQSKESSLQKNSSRDILDMLRFAYGSAQGEEEGIDK